MLLQLCLSQKLSFIHLRIPSTWKKVIAVRVQINTSLINAVFAKIQLKSKCISVIRCLFEGLKVNLQSSLDKNNDTIWSQSLTS